MNANSDELLTVKDMVGLLRLSENSARVLAHRLDHDPIGLGSRQVLRVPAVQAAVQRALAKAVRQ